MRLSILTLFTALIVNISAYRRIVPVLHSDILNFAFEVSFNGGFSSGYWGLQRRPPGEPPIAFSTNVPSAGSESYGIDVYTATRLDL